MQNDTMPSLLPRVLTTGEDFRPASVQTGNRIWLIPPRKHLPPTVTLHQLGFIGNFVLAGEHSSTVYLTAVPTTSSRRKLLLKDVSRRDRNTEGTWTQHEKTLHKNSSNNNNNNNNNTNNNNDNQPPTRHKEIKHYFYIFKPNNSLEIVPQSSRNHQEGIKLFKS